MAAEFPTPDAKWAFKAPRDFDLDAWFQQLAVALSVRQEELQTKHLEYFDTAGWRLARNSLWLFSNGERLWLCSSSPAGPSLSAYVSHAAAPLQRLPEGELKDRVEATLEKRPLRKQFAVESTMRRWRILNPEEKTVACLFLTENLVAFGAKSSRTASIVEVRSLRGYEKIGRKLSNGLKERGCRRVLEPHPLQGLAMEEKNVTKDAYHLLPWMPALVALRIVLYSPYRVIRDKEEGIRQDRDAEYLHDYRVAVRRTRTVWSELRGVWGGEQTEAFRCDFSWLGKATNRLRDLDVYLLRFEDYARVLPGSLRHELHPFFAELRRERQDALREFLGVLDSAHYGSVMDRWEAFLEGEGTEEPGPDASREIIELVRKRVARRCGRVVKKGRQVTFAADPESFHALRIECKHLRYLLEFFSGVLPDARRSIRQLKKLQDGLGRLQDLTVHEKRLAGFIHEFSPGDAAARPGLLSAATQLRQRMQAEQQRIRSQVPGLFAEFFDSLGKTDPPYAIAVPWL